MQRRSERRRFVRVSEGMVASITTTGALGPGETRTLNFSLGGVLVESERRLEPGTDVAVVLRVADDGGERMLEFTARVVRARSLSDRCHELALEFAEGSAADQQALQSLIADRLAPEPFTPRTA